jgi:hypothetical protein
MDGVCSPTDAGCAAQNTTPATDYACAVLGPPMGMAKMALSPSGRRRKY